MGEKIIQSIIYNCGCLKSDVHVVILTCNENYMCNKIDVADCDKLKNINVCFKKTVKVHNKMIWGVQN